MQAHELGNENLERSEMVYSKQFNRYYYIDYKIGGMDIEQSGGQKSARNRKNSGMESQPHDRSDLFEQMLNLNISEHEMQIEDELQQAKTQRKYNKRVDIRKILNSSSSNDRLLPTSLKNDSSRENSERARNNYETENSMDQQSVRQSFKKRYDESFSVENTIRDSSSSFSQKSDSKSFHRILPSQQYREEEGIVETEEKKFGCNCKRSKCLKLYCECFQRQLYCNQNCKCYDCGNTNQNQEGHKKAVISALARNARGFEDEKKRQDKVESHQGFSLGVEIQQVRKGCKCRKTHCTKKYCQCYHTGSLCGLFCRCQDCHNTSKLQDHRNRN